MYTELAAVLKGDFAGGRTECLGLAGESPEWNFVRLAPSTRFSESFTENDYKALVGKMYKGEIVVSDSVLEEPTTMAVSVDYLGSIK